MKLSWLTCAMAPVLILLFLFTHVSAAKILDGSNSYEISTYADYHYMITLYSHFTDGTLEFHWNPVSYKEVNTARHPDSNPKYK